jgi:hypothetical protein
MATMNLTISDLRDALNLPLVFNEIIKLAQTELQRGNTVVINEKYTDNGIEVLNELVKFTDILKFTDWVSETFNV